MFAQERDEDEEGNDGEILQDKDGKRQPSNLRRFFTLLGDHLQDDGSGRQCQPAADDDGDIGVTAQAQDNGSDDSGGDEQLRAAETEHMLAHAAQPLQRQLQPD